jgi:hypothetical protein
MHIQETSLSRKLQTTSQTKSPLDIYAEIGKTPQAALPSPALKSVEVSAGVQNIVPLLRLLVSSRPLPYDGADIGVAHKRLADRAYTVPQVYSRSDSIVVAGMELLAKDILIK